MRIGAKPYVALVDIDGTLFASSCKAHPGDAEEWRRIAMRPVRVLAGVRKAFAQVQDQSDVIIVTARPPVIERETRQQLRKHFGWRGDLRMCPVGVSPADFKRKQAEQCVKVYNHVYCIDDLRYEARGIKFYQAPRGWQAMVRDIMSLHERERSE